jgi:Ser/Thr protein kinase RdoA (MazF antagonist)
MTTSTADTSFGRTALTVARSILSADAMLGEVRRLYELDECIRCELLKFHINDTYLLQTESGDYILRLYGLHARTVAEIRYELELLNHLSAKEISVATPLADREGSLTHPIATGEGVRQLVVFVYLKGVPLAWDASENCARAGRTLAELHHASDDFRSAHSRRAYDETELLDRPLSALQPFVASRSADWTFLQAFADRMRARMAAMADNGLDWGVCHGDLAARNLLKTEDDRLAVLDFDHCGPGYRAYDFAEMFGAAVWKKRSDLWDAFWSGYTQRRPLTPADRDAVPVFLALRHLSMLGMIAERSSYLGTAPMRDTNLDGWLGFLRDCETQHMKG